ncbi:MAG: hypothetical protein JXA21_04815 [Anaerolineae bacterium]|nr:hypothetical protein [Anaerolineae bacterium]
MRSAITRHTKLFINKVRWFMICALACLALSACTIGIVKQEALVPATGVSPTSPPDFVSSTTTSEPIPTTGVSPTPTPDSVSLTPTPEPIPTATPIMPPPTQTMLPTPPPATPNLSTSTTWTTYHNNTHGFTFEYPAAYDETPHKDACGIKENDDGIHLGYRIDVQLMELNGLNLIDYATALLQSKGWTLESMRSVTINDLKAVTFVYRFGGTNRYGTITLIEDDMRVFSLNFSDGSFCNIPEAQVSEPAAYAHILETFRLIP